jgi:hypothetical protein
VMSDVADGVPCGGDDVRARVAAARVALTAAESTLVAVTVEAVRSGALSQVAAAREAGVDRHTVRGWLGLPRKRPARHAGGS